MSDSNLISPAAAHDPARLAEEVYGEMVTPFNDCAIGINADSDRALIAHAIAAERERCAVVAESVAVSEYLGKGHPPIDRNHEIIKLACHAAATAIRSGK